MVEELDRFLSYPKLRLTSAKKFYLFHDYVSYVSPIELPPAMPLPAQCRDGDDDIFLAAAHAAKADALVTGDRDLLVLAAEFPVPILTPAEFRERFRL